MFISGKFKRKLIQIWSPEKINRACMPKYNTFLCMEALRKQTVLVCVCMPIYTIRELSSIGLNYLSMFKRIPCSNLGKSIISISVSIVNVCSPAYLWGRFMDYMIAIQHSIITLHIYNSPKYLISFESNKF